MKRKLIVLTLLAVALTLNAQCDLTKYYANTDGLNQGALKTALYNIIKNPKVVGYDNLWSYFPLTDYKSDGTVWDMYSNNTYTFPDDGTSATIGMDREHAFPKSWWTSEFKADHFDCYSDLFNLNPADAVANQNIKSNWTMGEVDIAVTRDNGVIRKGTSTLYGAYSTTEPHTVWEPADEYKGDFARAYMYVVTCYEFISYATSSNGPAWSSDAEQQITWNSKETYPLFTDWTAKMLLDWHHNDPVSEKELNRNETIYGIQGNRNPFIDCPEFADYIWGDKKSEAFDIKLVSGQAFFSTPKNGETYAFKSDSIGKTRTLKMAFRANNITKPVNWELKGTTKGQFKLPSTQLTVSALKNGNTQTITYTSSVPAHDTIQLVLTSEELLAPVTIKLTAETYDCFQLLAPSVADEAFTIRWLPSADATEYEVNVFQPKDTGEMAWTNLLSEDFRWQSFPTDWTYSTSEKGYRVGVALDQQNFLRLASSANDGFVQTPSYSMGDSIILTTYAARYNNSETQSGTQLTLLLNSQEANTHDITADFQLYKDTLYTGDIASATLQWKAYQAKQVWIDSVRVDSYQHVESQVAISNEFPAITSGNQYIVNNLVKGEDYWFTVKPLGGEFSVKYGPVKVTTGQTALKELLASNVTWYVDNSNTLHLQQLPVNAHMTLYNTIGQVIFNTVSSQNYLDMHLNSSGIYILQIDDYQPIKIIATH